MNFNGLMSPQSPYGVEGFQPTGSPAFNLHQRHQSLQYLPQQMARASPRLQEVREDEEEEYIKSPSKTPEPVKHNPEHLQSEIDDAEYHLEEQLRNALEHEDYNPHAQAETINTVPFAPAHTHHSSGNFATAEHFASEPSQPLVLHHPRPHSRGHSLTQNFFRGHTEVQETLDDGPQFRALNDIPETQKADESCEIQTNPSNLGTPVQVQDIDFATAFGHHQKTMSTGSNPWQDSPAAATNEGSQRSDRGSKSSFSGFNVKAPEFKFNPNSTFTPGLFNFSASSFQPAVFQAAMNETTNLPPSSPVPSFGASKINVNAPAFSPGQSEFSFSTSGPKFRPDAPSFTPFQSLADSTPTSSGKKGLSRRTDSIFGNIQINPIDLVKPAKNVNVVQVMRPPSSSSAQALDEPVDDPIDEDLDGRPNNSSRAKRAKSAAPDGDFVPSFADRPTELSADITATLDVKEDQIIVEEESVEGDNALPADTSLSSIVTSDQIETKATTAAPSEISPAEQPSNEWTRLDFKSKSDAQLSSEDDFEPSHKKSLSATAPIFLPGASSLTENESRELSSAPSAEASVSQLTEPDAAPARRKLTPKGLGASRFASPPPKPKGLAASRFANTPSPAPAPIDDDVLQSVEQDAGSPLNADSALPSSVEDAVEGTAVTRALDEPTFEEIDAVMQHLENDPSMGVNKYVDSPGWPQSATEAISDELQLPGEKSSREGTSLTPRQHETLQDVASHPIPSTELDDPFLDPPLTSHSVAPINDFDMPAPQSDVASDWEGAFSEDEHTKLESRAQFFDGRVNEIVGGLLTTRLEPLEKALFSIQDALALKARAAPSSRRELRSASGEFRDSDADDEDDEPPLQRSMSPRRDRKMEQIRIAVSEALASQQPIPHIPTLNAADASFGEGSAVLKALEEIKEQFAANLNRGEDADTKQVTPLPLIDDELAAKVLELQAKAMDLEQRLHIEQTKVEKEVTERRAAEDASAELNRKLQAAETRVEVEIINRSVFDQRVADLEERLRHQENQNEEEVKARRAAEDKFSEVDRQLRMAQGEEARLRDVMEEKDQRVKSLEQSAGKASMRMALLEAAQNNSTQSRTEMTNRVNILEADLRNVRQDNTHWRTEAERADEAARRSNGERAHTLEENKRLQRSLETVSTQLEENERLRESWRVKFLSLQEDMGQAAREVAEENARHIKKDQAMLARQEVLEARLHAESKTRERFEVEMERLQENERSGMRAVNECKRLENLLSELRTENHQLQQAAARYQREFQEARESGVSEVKRTRMALQTEVDSANNQVNVIREELEEHNSKLRTELDSLKLEADTARAQNEMLLEDAHNSKASELDELVRKHQNELEDVQTRYERQVNNAMEDGQKTEQHLLERLSLSAAKTEHLQDRIVHLEDKLDIAKQAAAAAAQAAKSVTAEPVVATTTAQPKSQVDAPERISPQALRESIMVLQEQLQAREQRIEELEHTVSKADPDAASKISKRDDEISWLRELLAVRQGDLQDIIYALSEENYDRVAVKDAAIRLKANLQMEEQERERAVNGGSAISLPNIAQTIQSATPRVVQAVGPIAAAWGNWRKGSQSSFRNLSGVLNTPAAGNNATPSKSRSNTANQSSLLSGLLTPPASGFRQTLAADDNPQPTAFSSTGRRFTSQSAMQSRTRGESNTSHRSDRLTTNDVSPRRQRPMTPPMAHQNAYDSDAQPGDFDDHDFFEED